MSETRLDILTLPNAMTAARLLASPWMSKRLGDNPSENWRSAAAFVTSDIVDGAVARLGDKSALLSRFGLRTSEAGRLLDPFADKIVIAQMVKKGMDKGIVPSRLGTVALAQKAAISAHTLYSTAQGAEIHVSPLGKRSEFLTNMGIGLLFAAEEIEDSQVKSLVRGACVAAAALGIAGAMGADLGYAKSAHEQLAQHPVSA